MTYILDTVEPKHLKRKDSKITCFKCGLKYPKGEYDILRKNKKLIYFKFSSKTTPVELDKGSVFCHGCLFQLIKKMHPEIITKIKVFTPEFEYDLEFDPKARLHDDDYENGADDSPYFFD